MHRNLFAVFATLLLSAGAATASTPATDQNGLSLEQRVQAAQRTISKLMDVTDEQAATPDSERLAQYWSNYYRPWRNWNNWRNWSNYYNPYRY
jgi:rSAM-associated Gly-rich repeat protein